METWPATLPQILLIEGYEEKLPDVNLRSAMEVGPAKVRRRVTAAVRPVTGQLIMTLAQIETFKGFYNDDLLGGSLRFGWFDPYDETTMVEMRFTEVPALSPVDPGLYKVSMKLEILP
jgi:hypothetical protein